MRKLAEANGQKIARQLGETGSNNREVTAIAPLAPLMKAVKPTQNFQLFSKLPRFFGGWKMPLGLGTNCSFLLRRRERRDSLRLLCASWEEVESSECICRALLDTHSLAARAKNSAGLVETAGNFGNWLFLTGSLALKTERRFGSWRSFVISYTPKLTQRLNLAANMPFLLSYLYIQL